MSKIIIKVLLLGVCLYQFTQGQEIGKIEKPDAKISVKVDEFGAASDCDLGARIDSFFIELKNVPTATGYIILYKGKDFLPANYNFNPMRDRILKTIKFGRLDQNRIIFIYGGFREELSNELFVVPEGAEIPKPTETIAAPTIPRKKTFLYNKKYLDTEDLSEFLQIFVLPSVKAALEAENEATEQEFEKENKTDEIIEPQVLSDEEPKEPELTLEEEESLHFLWMDEEFGAQIKKFKSSKGVIVFYADDAYYDIANLQNFIDKGKERIAEANKISSEKIEIIYGGYRSGLQAEFWVVPAHGEFPQLKPEERPVEDAGN